ncbi:MAG TPA: nitroreductase family protein [Acholeplasmataceae bacterium]|jgi:nitroreductase|nr:nitroreductase family protein [Acholeplasmataceae bacterium]
MSVIFKRRSVRNYLPDPIEKEKIDKILRAAMQAPSARNQKPWRFLVIQDREELDRLSEVAPNLRLLKEAPVAIFTFFKKENLAAPLFVQQDLSVATMNILLQATELGIGNCWLGLYPNTERTSLVNNALGTPEDLEVFSAITLGYPKDPDALHFVNRYEPEKVYYEKF